MTLLVARSDRKRIVATAAAVLSIAALAGCSEPDSSNEAGGQTSAAAASEAAQGEASPAFEGIDPCSLVPAEKAAEAAGVPEISAQRSPQDSPDIIGCDWGGFGVGTASLAFMVGPDIDMEHEVIGKAGDKDIEVMSGTPGNCAVQVQYSNERTMLVSVVPTPEAKASDQANANLKWCDQAADLVRTADSNLDWE